MQELIGVKIGPYQIQRHLACGGMANVYLARNVETEVGPLVAIKLVHASTGEHCERFCREAKEHYTLHHNHILPALAYGECNSWWYLVTPYIPNGTLAHRLRKGPLSIQDATEIFSQLAGALHYVHEQSLVHRDVKASNILMQDEHYAYLADFGLVKHVGLDASLTAPGCMMGTPEYMAPELAEEEATPRSDIYALGILLYQMLTGQVPFKGNTLLAVYLKHLREHPLTPTALNPAIPPEVGRVVLRALAKNPDDRYQTAQAFNIAYQQALAQADARQSERTKAVTDLYDTMLAVLLVRLVKRGDLHRPDGPQQQETTPLGRRRQQQGFVRPVAVSALLMLSLLSTSGMDVQRASLTWLVTQPGIQAAHAKGGPMPDLSPAPPMTPTPPPVVVLQQTSKNAAGNSGDSYDHSHGNKQDSGNNGNGSGHRGHRGEQGDDTDENTSGHQGLGDE